MKILTPFELDEGKANSSPFTQNEGDLEKPHAASTRQQPHDQEHDVVRRGGTEHAAATEQQHRYQDAELPAESVSQVADGDSAQQHAHHVHGPCQRRQVCPVTRQVELGKRKTLVNRVS